MDWISEIKKLRLSDLAVFSKTGEVVSITPRSTTTVMASQGYVSSLSVESTDVFIAQPDGVEFSVEASVRNLARPDHRMTVLYLGKVGSGKGYNIAYYNHTTRRLLYDYHFSGSVDGEYRQELDGGNLVPGCLSPIIAILGTIFLNTIFEDILGIEFVPVFFVILLIFSFYVMKNFAFQGGRRRVEHVRALVEAELEKIHSQGNA